MHAPALDRAIWSPDEAAARNMLLLTHLRWFAILGQFAAILTARLWFAVPLPLEAMIAVLIALVALNVATLVVLRTRRPVSNRALFAALLCDWGALTVELYLSGGATNPFAPIGVLQIVLSAVLLEAWSSWVLVALHSMTFGLLTTFHRPLELPPRYASSMSDLHLMASWVNFTLGSTLLVFVVTRVSKNLRMRDRRLAELRQRAAEEDHIVRMGLLASGAAHELATPLSSLSVILGDWVRQPATAGDAQDIAEMQAAVARCKLIVGGVLYASGEVRSEVVERTALSAYVAKAAADWSAQRPGVELVVHDNVDRSIVIVADRTLTQVLYNLFDNAVEAGASRLSLAAAIVEDEVRLSVADNGTGFAPGMLETVGKPYRSSKPRLGAGLGLFLAVNVLRKLGGTVSAANSERGGAVVTLAMPLEALRLEEAHG